MKNGSYFPGRGTLVEETFLKGEAKGKAEGVQEGQAKERARFVLHMLDFRGIPVSGSQRARIGACADVERLDRWARRALSAVSADDVFAGDGEDRREAASTG